METEVDWSIAVFARNEAASLPGCLQAIEEAARGVTAHLTVILNGTTDESHDVLRREMGRLAPLASGYVIPFADKANAWNQFVYALRPRAWVYFFIDAYARVDAAALRELADSLEADNHANAAAAVPSTGRSAAALRAAMIAEGGLHGSLFALRRSFLDRLTADGLRLPIGLYRGDGLIGSFVRHDLDARRPWDRTRIRVAPGATWRTRPLSPWRPSDIRRQARRMIQQRRGRCEAEALRRIIREAGFKALPLFADLMLADWLRETRAGEGFSFRIKGLSLLMRRALRSPRLPSERDITAIPL